MKIVWFVSLTVGLFLSTWLLADSVRNDEPSCGGRTLGEWLVTYQSNDARSPQRREAAAAIQTMGTNAIPGLLRIMSYQRPAAMEKSVRLLQRQNFVRINVVPAGLYRARGADGFEILGEQGKMAAPRLAELLGSRNYHVKYLAFISLLEVKPDPEVLVPALIKASKEEDPYIQKEAVNALRYLYPETAEREGLGGPVARESFVYLKFEVLKNDGESGV